MALYLLDKNVVEDIRNSQKSTASPGIALARKVDRKGSTISPILAIVEGSTRQPQAPNEIHSSLMADTQAVGMFYRHARTDAKALQDLDVEMIISFGTHWREKTAMLMPLGNALQMLLSRTYSTGDAKGVLTQIGSLCRTHSVERVHPLVTCAIACLYGHNGARKVLKPAQNPSEGDSYNAIADIRMLLEAAYIRRMWQEQSPREPVNLLSSDKNLNDFSRAIAVVAESSIPLHDLNVEVVRFKSTINEALFPSLMTKPKEMAYVYSYFYESTEAGARIEVAGA
ncbi:hypothetical protein PQR25_00075 [Paraburkholderia nemoris]|uniref:hypothetical protein n=1 Tax=Paraburkholderia nemoris TaxID=2793076 RepID=UPI0038B9226B